MYNPDSHWLSKAKLQETIAQSEAELQICAREFFATVHKVSKYNEFISSKTAVMKKSHSTFTGY